MRSKTPQTVEEIDALIGELRRSANELENDLRWQPHMKHIVEEFQDSLVELERDFRRRFVDAVAKGWIY